MISSSETCTHPATSTTERENRITTIIKPAIVSRSCVFLLALGITDGFNWSDESCDDLDWSDEFSDDLDWSDESSDDLDWSDESSDGFDRSRVPVVDR